MKIISVIVFVTLLITMQAQAQKALNIEVGVNASTRYVNARTMKPFSNYLFGLSWDIPMKFNENVFVRIGAGFAQDSKKLYGDIEGTMIDTALISGTTYYPGDVVKAGMYRTSLSISNFDIPLTIGYKKELGSIELNGQAGIFWSKHLSGYQYTKIIDHNVIQDNVTERTDNIWFGKDDADWRKADFGVTAKLGIKFPITIKEKEHKFELSGSMALGLVNQYHVETIDRKPVGVWASNSTYGIWDYAVTPEKLQRFSITLAYCIDMGNAETKLGE